MSEKTIQTLEDIARFANVSRSTVSRALNDSPLLSKETKERIQAIAREHNFRINAAARNLRLGKSRTIAFVAPVYHPSFSSSEDVFGLEMLGSIASGLHTLSYDCLIVYNDPGDTTWAHQYLDSGRVDGFILIGSNLKRSQVKALTTMKAPFIVWGMPMPRFSYCSVTGDNLAGGTLAAEHLIRTGRRRIAFLGGPRDNLTVQNRLKGYEQALQAAGRQVDPGLVVYGDYTYASGTAAMQHLLDHSPDLDAVFVNSDLMAIAAINEIQARGRTVPQDVAVIGYDDLSLANYTTLPLTTIRQNIPLAGKLLAQNLIRSIDTGIVTNETVPVELVIRQSA